MLISLFVLQVTNQVTRDSSTGLLKPALGRSWSFVPSTRVLLESKEATWEKVTTQRVASLAKSPRQVRLPRPVALVMEEQLCDVDLALGQREEALSAGRAGSGLAQ